MVRKKNQQQLIKKMIQDSSMFYIYIYINNQCKYVVIILTKQKPCILGNYKKFPEKILSGMKMKKMYVGG